MSQRMARLKQSEKDGARPFTAPNLPPLAVSGSTRSVSPPSKALDRSGSPVGGHRTSTPLSLAKPGSPMSKLRTKLTGAVSASHTLEGTKSTSDLANVPLYRLNLAKGNNTLQHSATESRLPRPKTAPEPAAKSPGPSDDESPSSPPAAAWGETSLRSVKVRRPVMSAFTKEMNEIAGRALADLSSSAEAEGKSVMAQLKKLQEVDREIAIGRSALQQTLDDIRTMIGSGSDVSGYKGLDLVDSVTKRGFAAPEQGRYYRMVVTEACCAVRLSCTSPNGGKPLVYVTNGNTSILYPGKGGCTWQTKIPNEDIHITPEHPAFRATGPYYVGVASPFGHCDFLLTASAISVLRDGLPRVAQVSRGSYKWFRTHLPDVHSSLIVDFQVVDGSARVFVTNEPGKMATWEENVWKCDGPRGRIVVSTRDANHSKGAYSIGVLGDSEAASFSVTTAAITELTAGTVVEGRLAPDSSKYYSFRVPVVCGFKVEVRSQAGCPEAYLSLRDEFPSKARNSWMMKGITTRGFGTIVVGPNDPDFGVGTYALAIYAPDRCDFHVMLSILSTHAVSIYPPVSVYPSAKVGGRRSALEAELMHQIAQIQSDPDNADAWISRMDVEIRALADGRRVAGKPLEPGALILSPEKKLGRIETLGAVRAARGVKAREERGRLAAERVGLIVADLQHKALIAEHGRLMQRQKLWLNVVAFAVRARHFVRQLEHHKWWQGQLRLMDKSARVIQRNWRAHNLRLNFHQRVFAIRIIRKYAFFMVLRKGIERKRIACKAIRQFVGYYSGVRRYMEAFRSFRTRAIKAQRFISKWSRATFARLRLLSIQFDNAMRAMDPEKRPPISEAVKGDVLRMYLRKARLDYWYAKLAWLEAHGLPLPKLEVESPRTVQRKIAEAEEQRRRDAMEAEEEYFRQLEEERKAAAAAAAESARVEVAPTPVAKKGKGKGGKEGKKVALAVDGPRRASVGADLSASIDASPERGEKKKKKGEKKGEDGEDKKKKKGVKVKIQVEAARAAAPSDSSAGRSMGLATARRKVAAVGSESSAKVRRKLAKEWKGAPRVRCVLMDEEVAALIEQAVDIMRHEAIYGTSDHAPPINDYGEPPSARSARSARSSRPESFDVGVAGLAPGRGGHLAADRRMSRASALTAAGSEGAESGRAGSRGDGRPGSRDGRPLSRGAEGRPGSRDGRPGSRGSTASGASSAGLLALALPRLPPPGPPGRSRRKSVQMLGDLLAVEVHTARRPSAAPPPPPPE